jgi:hypothetical protein
MTLRNEIANPPPPIFAVLPDYDALRTAIAARANELGLTHGQIDEVAGLAAGFASAALGPSETKRFGWLSTFLIAPELGLRVAFVIDEKALAARRLPARAGQPNQGRKNNYSKPPSKRILTRVFKYLGQRGAKARMRNTTDAERSAHARHAINARWRKARQAKRQIKIVGSTKAEPCQI